MGNIDDLAEAGSSPHTRGARYLYLSRSCCDRIIPAYAGSTPSADG